MAQSEHRSFSEGAAEPLEVEAAQKPAAPPGDPVRLVNVAIAVAFALNALVTFLWSPITRLPPNDVLSRKYQTLVTPKGAAFAIWGPIFIWEGVFAVVQLLPKFRASTLVDVVSGWWCAACIFQILWTIFFSVEQIPLSLVCMYGILLSLAGLMWRADAYLPESTFAEYWLLRAPFSLHAGWILCASAVNTNVQADFNEAEVGTLLGVAAASVAVVFAVTALYALAYRKPDPFVCGVVCWATAFIASELQWVLEEGDVCVEGRRPRCKDLLNNGHIFSASGRRDYGARHNPVWNLAQHRDVIEGVAIAAATLSVVSAGLGVLAILLRTCRGCLSPAAAPKPAEGGAAATLSARAMGA